MKIGLYGGMANNLYLLGKALSKENIDCLFIRQREDAFVFSQPFWEDVRLTVKFEQTSDPDFNSHANWARIEGQTGWQPEDWYVDPFQIDKSIGEIQGLQIGSFGFSGYDKFVLDQMQSCDALVVCGTNPAILAHHSGTPYVIQPAGGDRMIAEGNLRVNPQTRKEYVFGTEYEELVRNAFKASLCLGMHDPKVRSDLINKWSPFPLGWGLTRFKTGMLPTYTDVHRPVDGDTKNQLRLQLMDELGIDLPSDKKICLVPARVSFQWKGHDNLCKAFENKAISDKFHFIFTGWGDDYPALKKLSDDNGWSVTFIEFVMSKPILYDFMTLADVVVDNFKSGHYGTTGAEAIGRGTPVVMWVDKKQYSPQYGRPPMLSAKSSKEIERLFLKIANDDDFLSSCENPVYDWAESHHSSKAVSNYLLEIVGKS